MKLLALGEVLAQPQNIKDDPSSTTCIAVNEKADSARDLGRIHWRENAGKLELLSWEALRDDLDEATHKSIDSLIP